MNTKELFYEEHRACLDLTFEGGGIHRQRHDSLGAEGKAFDGGAILGDGEKLFR